MSQKKQLSIMDNVESISDHELRAALKSFNLTPGPITDSTRNLYRKKLASLIAENDKLPSKSSSSSKVSQTPKGTAAAAIEEENEDDDTSDEDFHIQDEDLEEDEDDESEDELDDEDEDLMSELQEDDIEQSGSKTTLTRQTSGEPHASPNRISRYMLVLLVSFFVAIFFLANDNFKLLETLQFKKITRQLLILLVLLMICFIPYKIVRFYWLRRREQNERLCQLVREALELLQSPDNPGSLPVLHIRDTLITPAERRNKKTMMLWTKAVEFIEEHESRVKVELVNIDGEDFRGWKWIGSKKI